jgi:hypothetical protein
MVVVKNRLGSDHHPILVTLNGLCSDKSDSLSPNPHNVWRLDKIPHYGKKEYAELVDVFQRAFERWGADMKSQLEDVNVDVEANRMVNLLEHSFQECLDDITSKELGSKRVRPTVMPKR